MKPPCFLLIAASFAVLVSCGKEKGTQKEDPEGGIRQISARFADIAPKTVVGPDGTSILWDKGQKVFLFDGKRTDTPAIQTDKQQDEVGTLTTERMDNDIVIGGVPYEYFATCDASAVCTVPAVQDGSANSAFVALAKSGRENELSFSPAAAVIRITVSREVDSVRFSASSAAVAGSCTVDYAGEPSLSTPYATSSSVVAKPSSKSAEFFIAVLPCTDFFNIHIYRDGDVAQMTMKTSLTFSKGDVYPISVDEASLCFAVDLGLSVKWASYNIGASGPEESGTYFAWGDVTGQTWNGSAWSDGGFFTFPVYEIDADGNLKPEYDAASVGLGGAWRMPTAAEQQELIANCTLTWTNDYKGTGVAGGIFTGSKEGYTGKSVFLPAVGSGYDNSIFNAGTYGYYWSGTFRTGEYAWCLYYGSGVVGPSYSSRHYGLPVRPVME